MTGNGGGDGEEGEEEGGPGGDVGGEQVVDVDPTLESESEEIVNFQSGWLFISYSEGREI